MSIVPSLRRGVSRRRVLASSSLAAVALAACGPQAAAPQSGNDSGKPLAQRAPVTLEFWGDAPPASGTNQRMDQIAAWNAKYPNLKVNYGANASTGQGVDSLSKFVAAVAAGTAPNAVDFDRFQVATYANRKTFQPLDDFVKRDKYDMKKFVPAVLQEAMGFDQKTYGLPRSTDDRFLWWNKDVFQDAGLDPEKAPATWDELRQFAIRITKRGGANGFERIGFHTEEGQSHYHIFAWQNGGSFQTQDGKKATLNQAQNQEALQWMADLMRDIGGWGPLKDYRATWGSNNGQPSQNPLLTGQLGMIYQTNGFAGGTIAKYKPDLKFGVAPPPVKKAGDKLLTWSGGFSYVITRDSKNSDISWELLKWLISEEGWIAGYDGDLARAKSLGGIYQPGMTGQPDLDKKMYAKYQTGIPAVDKVPDLAVNLMNNTRFRELSIAAADLWDGVKHSQTEGISQDKSAKQALEDNNVLVQKALDQAWQSAS